MKNFQIFDPQNPEELDYLTATKSPKVQLLNFRHFAEIKSYQKIRSYKIIQPVGKGGNGIVYLALCTQDNKRLEEEERDAQTDYRGQFFALKLFQNVRVTERTKRFYTESLILKNLNHPSIIKHYDSGIYYYSEHIKLNKNKYPFFVTSYIPQTLHDIIGEISFLESLIFTIQLLSAVSYLHLKGIIHRDIKPKNIFIHEKTAILGDFGLIKQTQDNLIFKGKEEFENDVDSLCYGQALHYRSPDIISYIKDGTDLTPKSDIIQLGLVIAEMFTKENPQSRQKYRRYTTARDRYLSPIQWKNNLSCRCGEMPKDSIYDSEKIASIINGMLHDDPQQRLDADTALTQFMSVFSNYAEEKIHDYQRQDSRGKFLDF